MSTVPGRLLLLLASRDLQTVDQLAMQVHQNPVDTLRQLQGLVTRGFIVVTTGIDGAVYHLRPKQNRADTSDLQERVLVVEENLLVRELSVMLLEDEQYAVIMAQAPVDAVALLEEVTFELVITGSFARSPAAMLLARTDLLQAAGATPVALFTAHRVDPAAVQAAGFAGILAKPYDIDDFLAWARGLLTASLAVDRLDG